jgi:hypothetical protein
MSNLETRQGKLLQVVFAARPEFELRLEEIALWGASGTTADSGRRRKGFRGERENDSGVKANGIPG